MKKLDFINIDKNEEDIILVNKIIKFLIENNQNNLKLLFEDNNFINYCKENGNFSFLLLEKLIKEKKVLLNNHYFNSKVTIQVFNNDLYTLSEYIDVDNKNIIKSVYNENINLLDYFKNSLSTKDKKNYFNNIKEIFLNTNKIDIKINLLMHNKDLFKLLNFKDFLNHIDFKEIPQKTREREYIVKNLHITLLDLKNINNDYKLENLFLVNTDFQNKSTIDNLLNNQVFSFGSGKKLYANLIKQLIKEKNIFSSLIQTNAFINKISDKSIESNELINLIFENQLNTYSFNTFINKINLNEVKFNISKENAFKFLNKYKDTTIKDKVFMENYKLISIYNDKYNIERQLNKLNNVIDVNIKDKIQDNKIFKI